MAAKYILLGAAAIPLVYYGLALYCTFRFFHQAGSANLEDTHFCPPVSCLKPIKGLDPDAYENYASFCQQDYPDYEILFCVDADDPALPLIERLQGDFPERRIRILIGSGHIAINDKVARLVRLTREAQHDLFVISDGDVRVRPDYLRTVTAPFRDPQVGAATCLYVATKETSWVQDLQSIGMTSDFFASVMVAWKLDGVKFTLGQTIVTRRKCVEGYGGYQISMSPFFLGSFGRVWLDQGGVYAIANLRGGGEYGEEWHKAGNLTRKQNVFDDFIACAQHLIDRRYSSPAHLAILGGSNGGLLMGAAFTQRPDLFRAVVSFVGIYDMLRVELDPNGAFNATEFGTVKDPEQFKALYAYSPYHHVQDGTAYPAILFLTGENDHRVNPMQSRKMTARLQAANGSGHPILLRTTSSAGHGIGTSLDEEIEQGADVFSFLLDQLGIQYTQPGAN